MSATSLTTLVNAIGPDKVTGFFLVLARVAPLFVLAPLFSSKMLPTQVRTIVAVGLAVGLTPLAVHGQRVPTDPLAVTGLMVEQILVGLAFSLALAAVFAAVEAAGTLTDLTAGFSFGSIVDPVDNSQGGPMTSLYGMIGLAMFIAIGGDGWMLRGLARTFSLVPLTAAPPIRSMTAGIESAVASILISAVELAAPVLLALLITDVAFGMVSKVVPQVSVFAVGFPMKIGIAILIVGAALPFLGGFMTDQIAGAVNGALQAL